MVSSGLTLINKPFIYALYGKDRKFFNRFFEHIFIFAGFLTTSISILYSIQDKDFIKIAKTSGAYQDLLKLIYKTIGWCVLSIVAVIIAKLITADSVKLIPLSICFGALSAVILAGFLFIKLMCLNK